MTVDLERLADSRAAQGLPPKLTDPVAIRKLAVLFSASVPSVDAHPPTHASASAEARGSETRSKKSDGPRTHEDRRSDVAG